MIYPTKVIEVLHNKDIIEVWYYPIAHAVEIYKNKVRVGMIPLLLRENYADSMP